MVVEPPKANKVLHVIVFAFFSVTFLLFNSISFAQIAINCSTILCDQEGQNDQADDPSLDCTQVKCVKIEDGKLWVYSGGVYKPYFIKGVGYQPVPIGRHVSDWGWGDASDPRSDNIYDDPAILNRDFSKLQFMHANTIRLWKGNDTQEGARFPNKLTERTMTLAAKYNLKVIAGFWVNDLTFDSDGNINDRQDIINKFVEYVNNFKQYPAVLFWAIGNENNYNKINGSAIGSKELRVWYALVNDMARAAHEAEGANFHPVAIVNGEIQDIGNTYYGTTDGQMPDLDIWGANVYRGKSFGSLFNEYQKRSQKPLWISEFGPSAWHVNDINNPDNGYEDQETQSNWTGSLWDEIARNAPVTIGGTVMEYSDEWWKPSEWYCVNNNLSQDENAKLVDACNSTQHHYGYREYSEPGGFSAEQWYGIMSIARDPDDPKGPDIMKERKLYYTLQEKWQPAPDSQLALKELASEVVLKSGQKLDGNIVKQTDKLIKIDVGVGMPVTFFMDEINTINGKRL